MTFQGATSKLRQLNFNFVLFRKFKGKVGGGVRERGRGGGGDSLGMEERGDRAVNMFFRFCRYLSALSIIIYCASIILYYSKQDDFQGATSKLRQLNFVLFFSESLTSPKFFELDLSNTELFCFEFLL